MPQVGRPRSTLSLEERKQLSKNYQFEYRVRMIKKKCCDAVLEKYKKDKPKCITILDKIMECDTTSEVRNIIKKYFTVEEYKNIMR